MEAARECAGRLAEYAARECAVANVVAGQQLLGQLLVIFLGSGLLLNIVFRDDVF